MTISSSTSLALPVDPDTAVKSAITVWEMRKLVQKPVLKVRRYIKRNNVCVVVFGPGGVGKTTLGKALAEDFDPRLKPEDYKESIDKENYWLRSDPAKKVIMAPGQEQRIEQHWPALFDTVTRAKTAVLVNVVSYGYHAVSKNVMLKEENSIDQYLDFQRQRELEIIAYLVNSLLGSAVTPKIVTLVTKQDLWWKKRDEVQNYYESGSYSEQIARLRTAKGRQSFAHEYVYTSLFLHNLKTAQGREIALTAEGYDDIERFNSQKTAFEVIEKLIK